MKTIRIDDLKKNPAIYDEIVRVLELGELVCLPCHASYRIVADLTSETAVELLLQSKRRTRKAPSLVFIAGLDMLPQAAAAVSPGAERLARAKWPGPLTILFEANPDLPPKVIRQLCKATGKLGVRVPAEEVVVEVIRRFGRPLLVSSANKEKKSGASSPAQVRKNFVSRVALFVDAGDLKPSPSSTVVDLVEDRVVVTRPGAITEGELAALAE